MFTGIEMFCNAYVTMMDYATTIMQSLCNDDGFVERLVLTWCWGYIGVILKDLQVFLIKYSI